MIQTLVFFNRTLSDFYNTGAYHWLLGLDLTAGPILDSHGGQYFVWTCLCDRFDSICDTRIDIIN